MRRIVGEQPVSYDPRQRSRSSGFTILEILVVIVIIGILAAIIFVAYSTFTKRAVEISVQSDLDNASKKIKMFKISNGDYPETIDCGQPDSSTNLCIRSSSNNQLSYGADNNSDPKSFRITVSNGDNKYSNNQDNLKCPLNFIVVPGSTTYGTADFCVMKYEAKRVGTSTTPISQASGLPWVSISQTTAIANSPNVAGCTGCHLITEAEWMTIAQNVLSVPSNWNGGVVGTSYIYSGHNDNVPANALEASTNDSDGYYLTGQTTGNQRRTLTLTNGEVIWDLAGNVWDWTSGTVQSPIIQPGIAGAGYGWREWNVATTTGTLPVNPFPSYGTPAASGWNAGTNGIGRLYSSSDETGLRGFLRGGFWDRGSDGGVLTLYLCKSPSLASGYFGFRVSR